MRNLVIKSLVLGLGLIAPAISFADNPSSASVVFDPVVRTRISGIYKEQVSMRVVHNFSSNVETGGSCSVELSACVSRFVPLGKTATFSRTCTPTAIGTKTVAAGRKTARFNMSSKPVIDLLKKGMQVSFQTQSVCTDVGLNQDTITSAPRARKISRLDGIGVSATAFINALKSSLR